MYRKVVKPFLDKLVALVVFLGLLPVLLIVTALLYIANHGHPFFIQPRPGLSGKVFRLIKFKTMTDAKDARGELLSDDQRLTAIGKFVRKTSLDEAPQLLNVLKGDMSIVGPRPLLVEYLPLYNDVQRRRHEVRPGITGWAQVNGRNAISWQQRFDFDVWYVDHLEFGLDIKILFLTFVKVFKAEGISSNTSVTMEKFRGIKKVILQGGGGHARVVNDCLMAQGKTVVAVVDTKDSQLDIPRLDSYDPAFEPSAVTLIAIGDNRVRKKIVPSLRHAFTNAVHPSSIISPFAIVGNGCMILHRSIVQAGARIGDHVILNTASQVDHDCIIHDYAHIAPGAVLCGGVTVGEGTLIGAGAVITPGKKIGAWATVGAGAVVIDDVPDEVVVAGNPAKIIKQKLS